MTYPQYIFGVEKRKIVTWSLQSRPRVMKMQENEWHRVFYGVESSSGVMEWSLGAELWSGVLESGVESNFRVDPVPRYLMHILALSMLNI